MTELRIWENEQRLVYLRLASDGHRPQVEAQGFQRGDVTKPINPERTEP